MSSSARSAPAARWYAMRAIGALAAATERDHEARPQLLVVRRFGDGAPELGDELLVFAERQPEPREVLDGREPQPFEMLDLGHRPGSSPTSATSGPRHSATARWRPATVLRASVPAEHAVSSRPTNTLASIAAGSDSNR